MAAVQPRSPSPQPESYRPSIITSPRDIVLSPLNIRGYELCGTSVKLILGGVLDTDGLWLPTLAIPYEMVLRSGYVQTWIQI